MQNLLMAKIVVIFIVSHKVFFVFVNYKCLSFSANCNKSDPFEIFLKTPTIVSIGEF